MDVGGKSIPKVLWNYWVESPGQTREIRDVCRRSWRELGGFDEIVEVRPKDLHRFLPASDLPVSFAELPPQKQANAVRVGLLYRYGGVWADASVLTTSDVPGWLQQVASDEGVFFFRDVDRGRLLDNWFLAASEGSGFMGEWMEAYNRFFSNKRIHMAHSQALHTSELAFHLLARLNNSWVRSSPSRTRWWARKPLSELPFYPYFIHHYLANDLLTREPHARVLRTMRYAPAADALALRSAINRGASVEYQQMVQANARSRIQKLNLHIDYDPSVLVNLEKLVS